MDWIIKILANGLLILGLSRILEGIKVQGFTAAVIAAVLFSLVNTFIRPVLLFVSFPVNLLTLGLFTFVINALMVLLVGKFMTSFQVRDFWWALVFSVCMSIGSVLLSMFGIG
ncbi:MAG: phage holin family protein [Bacteroidia bacterium]|nr:phage holin family protein [Bacteroidia bacterium]